MTDLRIGVDLGGTKIEAVVLDAHGTEVVRRRVLTPREDYAATIGGIAALVTEVEAEAGAPGTATVGVGMPGVPSPRTGLVKNANSTWLIGQPFAADLAAALGREVRCANDANCFALSEAHDGAGAGMGTVFGVILGTGVGGGIVIDGAIVTGGAGVAGEWGHTPLPWMTADEHPGPDCYCGKLGCVETWLSGPSLRRDHARVTGQDADGRAIAAAAADGDAAAQATLDRYIDRLARGLASIVNVLDPDVFVLGGGVSNLDVLYPAVEEALPGHAFGAETDAVVRRAVHGDSSGVRGAAWLWG